MFLTLILPNGAQPVRSDYDYETMFREAVANTNLPLDESDPIDVVLIPDYDVHTAAPTRHDFCVSAHNLVYTDIQYGNDATAYKRMLNPHGDVFLERLLILAESLESQLISLGSFGADVTALFDEPSQIYRFAMLQEYAHLLRQVKHLRLLYSLQTSPVPSPAEWSAILLNDSSAPTQTALPTRIQTPNLLAARMLEQPMLSHVACSPDTRHMQLPAEIMRGNQWTRQEYKRYITEERPWAVIRAGSYEVWTLELLAAGNQYNAIDSRGKGKKHVLLLDERIPLPSLANFTGWDGVATLLFHHLHVPRNMVGDLQTDAHSTLHGLYERMIESVGFVPIAVVTYLTPTMPATFEHKSTSHAQTVETEYHHSLHGKSKAHDHDEYDRICYGFAKLETVVLGMHGEYEVMASTDITSSSREANFANMQHANVIKQFLNMKPFEFVHQRLCMTGVFDPYSLDETPLPANWPRYRPRYAIDAGYRALASSYSIHFRIDSQDALHEWRKAYCEAAVEYAIDARLDRAGYYGAIINGLAKQTVIRPRVQTQVSMTEKQKNRAIADEVFGEIFGDS